MQNRDLGGYGANPAVGPAITPEGHDVLGHGNRCQRLQPTWRPARPSHA
jgi:hypothetical protein